MQNLVVTYYASDDDDSSETVPIKYESVEKFLADFEAHFNDIRDNGDIDDENTSFDVDGYKFEIGYVNSAYNGSPLENFDPELLEVSLVDDWFTGFRNERLWNNEV